MTDDLIVKKSKIDGNGVFTKKEIKKRQTVWVFRGELCTLGEMIRRVREGKENPSDPLQIGDEEYLDLDPLSRTFNHFCSPNCFVRGGGESELVAFRDINKGEEITFDYSTTMGENEEKIKKTRVMFWTCPCRCGSSLCRGIIDQFRTLPKKVQNFYIKNKHMPDFMLKKFG